MTWLKFGRRGKHFQQLIPNRMTAIAKIAEELIEAIWQMFHAEESLRRVPNGLEWGRPGGRQRLWWENPVEGTNDGPNLVRMRILTEVFSTPQDPRAWPEELRERLLEISENNLWGGLMLAEEMGGSLCLGSAASAHSGNAGYLALILFRAMASQAAVRESLFEGFAEATISKYAVAETDGDMFELAESIRLLLASRSFKVPTGVDADLAFLTKQFQDPPCLMCNGDNQGLSAEFPYGGNSSMLLISVDAEHPLFGPAINIALILPIDSDYSSVAMEAVLEMNRKEQSDHDIPWSFGSWCIDQQMSPCLGYRLWIPYAMFQQNLLINLAIGMAARARRCCEKIARMSFDEAYPLALEKVMNRLEQLLGRFEGDAEQS
jgi:hypothetical protein